jgi:hypothetical protein
MRYVCHQCGKTFSAYRVAPKYCSAACYGKSCRSPVSELRVIKLYQSGMTLDEVARATSSTAKVCSNILIRNLIPKRLAEMRKPTTGKRHRNWKGDTASYSAFHARVHKRLGKAMRCDRCGLKEASRRCEWANLTGRYNDIDDYKMMCVPCHRRYDAARARRSRGEDVCRVCGGPARIKGLCKTHYHREWKRNRRKERSA